ncbi:MAG: hypothetical protein AAFR71_05685 [Pseudomonadota bacterium]
MGERPESTAANRQKQFVLGVGAQRAGSSWIYKQFCHHPKVATGLMKEFHVWDAITVSACRDFLDRHTYSRDPAKKELRTHLQSDPNAYFDHFAELLESSIVLSTCDLTPEHAALSEETFLPIQDELAKRGIGIKVIFKLRDPFERCWSTVRMNRRNAALEGGLLPWAKGFVPEKLHLAINYRKERYRLATKYDVTLKRLYGLFQPERVHVGLFENMFTETELTRLEKFLGIEFEKGSEKVRANNTQKSMRIPVWLQRRIVKHSARVYDYCAEHYPQTRDHWPGAALLETIRA